MKRLVIILITGLFVLHPLVAQVNNTEEGSQNDTVVIESKPATCQTDVKKCQADIKKCSQTCTAAVNEENNADEGSHILVAIIASIVLFCAVAGLFLLLGKSIDGSNKKQKSKVVKTQSKQEAALSNTGISEGVHAAIAAAIHMYSEKLLDAENTVLTINKVSRTYSPWSSKIHGLNTYFRNRR